MVNYNVLSSPAGHKYWYRDGGLHREDGPAIEYLDGRHRWFLDGMEYPKHEYWYRYNTRFPHGCHDHDYLYGAIDDDYDDYLTRYPY